MHKVDKSCERDKRGQVNKPKVVFDVQRMKGSKVTPTQTAVSYQVR